ncbi:MAG: universal stress protein [Desulfovibrio sp.]|jgi:nucleotide-binding universal stress UspA family protein|nr:universal stress protein [Desulfovibrio sp.]
MRHILLATHGTPGAQKAEDLAAQWAREQGAHVTVLSIVNEDWKHMTGDDWLNTSKARNLFADYVEGQIEGEIKGLWERVARKLDGLEVEYVRRVGRPEDVLCQVAREQQADVIVMGAHQKKQAPGWRARFENKKLHPQLPCPMVVAP